MLGWQMFLHTIKSSNKLKGKKTQEVEADILATGLRVRVMVFNATFKNISVISIVGSVLLLSVNLSYHNH
jgi:hypothetical protein